MRSPRLGTGTVPASLLEAHAAARKVVEIGAGDRFDAALDWKATDPLREVLVTDVREVVRSAPPGLVAIVDDVTRPTLPVYEGADLLYGVRLPEELQVPAARLARRLGSGFAFRPLKDELADLGGIFPGPPTLHADAWRSWR